MPIAGSSSVGKVVLGQHEGDHRVDQEDEQQRSDREGLGWVGPPSCCLPTVSLMLFIGLIRLSVTLSTTSGRCSYHGQTTGAPWREQSLNRGLRPRECVRQP